MEVGSLPARTLRRTGAKCCNQNGIGAFGRCFRTERGAEPRPSVFGRRGERIQVEASGFFEERSVNPGERLQQPSGSSRRGNRGLNPRRANQVFGPGPSVKGAGFLRKSGVWAPHIATDGAKPKGAASGTRWQHRGKQRTLRWSKALRLRALPRRSQTGVLARWGSQAEVERNSERATAAVTRSGCREGKSFEGCMRHLGRRAADGPLFGESSSSELEMWRTSRPVAGCNRPAGPARRKPSEPGGTARAEHARRLASSCRRAAFGQPGSGRAVLASVERQSLMNPKRGVPPQIDGFGQHDGKGPREPKRVFDGEGMGHESSALITRD
jgi:hypothetical protein